MNRYVDRDLERELDTLFSRLFPPGNDSDDTGFDRAGWSSIVDLDLPGVGIDEDSGGAGGEIAQLVALMRSAGRHAVPLPLVENHLALWAHEIHGEVVSDDISTIAPGTPRDDIVATADGLQGTAYQVAWAGDAAQIVMVVPSPQGHLTVAVDPGTVEIDHGVDLAGQPRATITASKTPFRSIGRSLTRERMHVRGDLLRSAQLAGAMERIADDTLRYVRDREQFNSPIGSFQSVQQHVVTVHQLAVMTSLCVERACAAYSAGADASFAVSATKIVAAQNAAAVSRAAHQAHGAIGMTREFPLHRLTRRLQTWRWDFTPPDAASAALGRTVLAHGSVRDAVTANRTDLRQDQECQ